MLVYGVEGIGACIGKGSVKHNQEQIHVRDGKVNICDKREHDQETEAACKDHHIKHMGIFKNFFPDNMVQ